MLDCRRELFRVRHGGVSRQVLPDVMLERRERRTAVRQVMEGGTASLCREAMEVVRGERKVNMRGCGAEWYMFS